MQNLKWPVLLFLLSVPVVRPMVDGWQCNRLFSPSPAPGSIFSSETDTLSLSCATVAASARDVAAVASGGGSGDSSLLLEVNITWELNPPLSNWGPPSKVKLLLQCSDGEKEIDGGDDTMSSERIYLPILQAEGRSNCTLLACYQMSNHFTLYFHSSTGPSPCGSPPDNLTSSESSGFSASNTPIHSSSLLDICNTTAGAVENTASCLMRNTNRWPSPTVSSSVQDISVSTSSLILQTTSSTATRVPSLVSSHNSVSSAGLSSTTSIDLLTASTASYSPMLMSLSSDLKPVTSAEHTDMSTQVTTNSSILINSTISTPVTVSSVGDNTSQISFAVVSSVIITAALIVCVMMTWSFVRRHLSRQRLNAKACEELGKTKISITNITPSPSLVTLLSPLQAVSTYIVESTGSSQITTSSSTSDELSPLESSSTMLQLVKDSTDEKTLRLNSSSSSCSDESCSDVTMETLEKPAVEPVSEIPHQTIILDTSSSATSSDTSVTYYKYCVSETGSDEPLTLMDRLSPVGVR